VSGLSPLTCRITDTPFDSPATMRSRSSIHVVFAGGGSAGRLYPGLAVAAHLKKQLPDAAITFVGGGKPIERHPVQAAGFNYVTIPSQPVPRNPYLAMRFVTDNVAGYWAARWYLKEHHASLVVGLGGYASAATVRAATSRKIPTVLLEQNAIPRHVTRWLAQSADMVCAGFDDVRAHLPPNTPLAITGNPARPAFERMYQQQQADRAADGDGVPPAPRERRLVVIGGADGARTINEFMPRALRRLHDPLQGWQVVHQTGEGQLQQTVDRYRTAGVEALTVSFIDEMAPVMFASDLVVCRAGGTTLSELALAGAPAVLVPYPRDVEAYQLANAEVVAAAGAATVIDESSLDRRLDQALADQLAPLLVDDSRRALMAENMRMQARPDAAALITDTIRSVLGASARSARLAA
jgi:UDP-N-acetylglucosamine--N-acetylmuramyl-(pentapeptide) pyrophosphoryl-undecaprenol N-acetylglucosamine transferase